MYGCETWVVTPDMLKVLESFHNKTARRIADMMPRLVNGVWEYPSLKRARKKAGLYTVEHYIRKRQNTLAQYIATRPIYQLCTAAEPPPPPGAPGLPPRNSRLYRWWTQPMRTTVAPVEDDLEDEDSLNSEEMDVLQAELDRANGNRDFDVIEDGLLLDPEELFHVEEAYAVLIRGDDREETDAGDSDVTGG